MNKIGDELRFVTITSSARVVSAEDIAGAPGVATTLSGLTIELAVSEATKCVRCWHRRADVGDNIEHPALCARCVVNVAGDGEQRRFA